MTQNRDNKIIDYFKGCGGIARFTSIVGAGFHPHVLRVAMEEKKIEKLARGLYKLTNHTLKFHPDFVLASLQCPNGVVCLISALSFHEATNEIPQFVDIAITSKIRANKIEYPPVRFYRFGIKSWQAGIEVHQIGRHEIRVYSIAKTIADCFKFRNKIGIDVAKSALKIAVKEKNTNPIDIMHYAKICRVDKIIKPILEAIL